MIKTHVTASARISSVKESSFSRMRGALSDIAFHDSGGALNLYWEEDEFITFLRKANDFALSEGLMEAHSS